MLPYVSPCVCINACASRLGKTVEVQTVACKQACKRYREKDGFLYYLNSLKGYKQIIEKQINDKGNGQIRMIKNEEEYKKMTLIYKKKIIIIFYDYDENDKNKISDLIIMMAVIIMIQMK